jgi:DNA replication and repair protein RecF
MAGQVAELRLDNLRCFATAVLEPSPGFNLFWGQNASGKTSVLEALYLLGRGTSFRAARSEVAIRHGADSLQLFAQLEAGGPTQRLGLEVSRGDGLTVRLDGRAGTRAELAQGAPVQILDPASHDLVRGSPADRRQFMDWGVFHVERGFLESWQRYRRGLQQRNAALRLGFGPSAWAWDDDLAAAGTEVDSHRRQALARLTVGAQRWASALLGAEIELSYQSGWLAGEELGTALAQARDRDLAMGSSQTGPHRADLKISFQERRARETVSRGQEKLLAASLLLAQVEDVAAALQRNVMLLVDEPAADLDSDHLGRLQAALCAVPAQVFVTALHPEALAVPAGGRTFHVEHGEVRRLL